MKKKLWIPLVIVIAAIMLCVSVWLVHGAITPVKLNYTVKPISQINYNNYNVFSRLDYKGTELAWQNSFLISDKLTVLDSNGSTSIVADIDAPFQLCGNRVVYLKNDELRWRDRTTGEDDLISVDVYSFLAVEDGVLYRSDSTLYRHQWGGHSTTISYGVSSFFYHNGTVYIVTEDHWLVEPLDVGNWRKIFDFQGIGYSVPIELQFQGDFAIYQSHHDLHYISLIDGKTTNVPIPERASFTDRVCYICDEKSLFLSFQDTHANGSIVTDVDNVNNGLWEYSTIGLKRKLCDEVFEQLYLFEGNQLFGVRNNDLFRIDTQTGKITKITQ